MGKVRIRNRSIFSRLIPFSLLIGRNIFSFSAYIGNTQKLSSYLQIYAVQRLELFFLLIWLKV